MARCRLGGHEDEIVTNGLGERQIYAFGNTETAA